MNKSVKILDCTLRDGGYVIDWMFEESNIQSIILNLIKSNVDIIECGFLKDRDCTEDKTFFRKPEDIVKYTIPNKTFSLMVNIGEYDISNFENCNNNNIKIRVAFKKHNKDDGLDYIKTLKELGWGVYANPMYTNTYQDNELENLLIELNKITPECVTIVDTLGNMTKDTVIKIYGLMDSILNKNISLGFHSHNSLKLSFENAKALLMMDIDRSIIIDSCVWGMGRGAGNLETETLIDYLNKNIKTSYQNENILNIKKSILSKFYEENKWGYSLIYELAAKNSCHPNYAVFLLKNKVDNNIINEFFNQIPENKKIFYDEEYVKNYLNLN